MNSREPGVIVFDFYDGATEGITSSLMEYGSCYFKVIAWDDLQDERLFIVNSVDQKIFAELVSLLIGQNESLLTKKIFMPKWTFENNNIATKVNNIIESCRANISSSELLVLGEGIDSSSVKIMKVDDVVKSKIAKIESMSAPGSLADWLPVWSA